MWRTGQLMEPYKTYGYSFLEVQTEKEQIFSYIKNRTGGLEEQRVTSPQSRYFARLIPSEKLGEHHSIHKFVIMDMRNNEIIASQGTVAYRGGWLGFGSVVCPEERLDTVTFVQQVLKPGKSKE